MKARVLFDFEPQESGHVRLRRGDVVELLSRGPPGDWSSAADPDTGVVGYFPSDYVQVLEEGEGGDGGDRDGERAQSETVRTMARALFDFAGTGANEMRLSKGDVVEVLTVGEKGGWCKGLHGAFPTDYVEILTAPVAPAVPAASVFRAEQASVTPAKKDQPAPNPTTIPTTTPAVGTRGAGFGLDAELAKKQTAKYDVNAERLVLEWIRNVTGDPMSDGFAAGLKNGQTLCRLLNAIKPGTVKKIETSVMPFKQMENISAFLRACRVLGVAEFDAFETLDLFEEKDLGAVIRCLNALSRAVQHSVPEFRGPYLELNFSAPTGVDVTTAPATMGLTTSSKAAAPSQPAAKAAPPPAAPVAAAKKGPAPNPTAAAITQAVGTRGAGFGLDAELARKQAAKYDVNAERLVLEWIRNVTGDPMSDGFAAGLKNGQTLCRLLNAIKPGTVKKIETSVMPFKQMENISAFLRACRVLGVAEFDAFETLDLFEEKDLGAVIRCLNALSRAVQHSVPEFRGPYLELNFSAPTGVDVAAAPATMGLEKRS